MAEERRMAQGWERGEGLAGGAVLAGAFHQISLMKWIYDVQTAGPGATDILSYAP